MNPFIYIPCFIPRDRENEILSDLKIFDNASGDTLSYSIFRGLAAQCKSLMTTINIPPVGPFPKCNRRLRFHGYDYFDDSQQVSSISFSTILIYQHYSIYSHVYQALKRKVNKDNYTSIIVYSINVSTIKAIIRLKKQGFKINLILIIPDFWDDMLEKPSFRNYLKSLLFSDVQDLYSNCDAFVLLTKQMQEKINVKRPFCIVEGMYNTDERRSCPTLKNHKVKRLFYSGMLHEKFGVGQLVRVVHELSNDSIQLRICGYGDYIDKIKYYSQIDPRIQYLGLLKREDVLKEQYDADLLINPRTSDGDFTRYSFPSKTIEYLASGTPSIIHKLPGIPEEYYNYCFTFDSGSDEDVKKSILDALNYTPNTLLNIGVKAQRFIIEQKNAIVQTKKIIDLMNSLYN